MMEEMDYHVDMENQQEEQDVMPEDQEYQEVGEDLKKTNLSRD